MSDDSPHPRVVGFCISIQVFLGQQDGDSDLCEERLWCKPTRERVDGMNGLLVGQTYRDGSGKLVSNTRERERDCGEWPVAGTEPQS